MVEILKQQQWLMVALVFFGIMAYIAWIRWQDRRWIDRRFDSDQVLAISFGVNYFGSATEPGKPRKSSGFLLLMPDRLFYLSHRFSLSGCNGTGTIRSIDPNLPLLIISSPNHSPKKVPMNCLLWYLS